MAAPAPLTDETAPRPVRHPARALSDAPVDPLGDRRDHRREPVVGRHRLLVASLIAVLGLGLVFAGQMLLVRPRIERQLQDASRRAVVAAGYPEVMVQVVGRDAVLYGAAARDRASLRAVVSRVSGVRKVQFDDTTYRVDSSSADTPGTAASGTAAPEPTSGNGSGAVTTGTPQPSAAASPADPQDLASIGATVDAGRVDLIGSVPSVEARDRFLTRLRATFAEASITDQLVIDPQAGDQGLQAFAEVLTAMGPKTRAGAASLRTGRMTVAGVLPDAAALAATRTAGRSAVGEGAGAWQEDDLVVARPGTDAEAPSAAQVAAQLTALPAITFPSRSSELTDVTENELAIVLDLLRANPTITLRIEGHTDATGTARANLQLSRTRANAVRGALVDAGIAPDRLTAIGYGSTRPLDPDSSDLADAVNRRVVFVATA